MKKFELDLTIPNTKEELHDYLMKKMKLPDYYGKNLDALYDCVSEIGEATAFGIIIPKDDMGEDGILTDYIQQVCDVFTDAEEENSNLAVFIM